MGGIRTHDTRQSTLPADAAELTSGHDQPDVLQSERGDGALLLHAHHAVAQTRYRHHTSPRRGGRHRPACTHMYMLMHLHNMYMYIQELKKRHHLKRPKHLYKRKRLLSNIHMYMFSCNIILWSRNTANNEIFICGSVIARRRKVT